ncbi:MAG: tetratricopeptide repeat protein [Treponema sp.]|nr:tetratricopeptide repeat protein [Treponema sp.]
MKDIRMAAAFAVVTALALLTLAGCASARGLSAEEYFAIGMAYFEIGQSRSANRDHYFREAERWLSRARAQNRTMAASAYNLGLLHFEMGRFEEAARQFEAVLARDPENALALRAAAYTRIRRGDFEEAARLYERFLALVPESADDGFNHALVLFAMERYPEAEEVLARNPLAFFDNPDFLLLYARAQARQDKPEALDSFAQWIEGNPESAEAGAATFEFAQALESAGNYARALDEFRAAGERIAAGASDPSRAMARFGVARVLLVADPANPEGISELRAALEAGFEDMDSVEALLDDERISASHLQEIRAIIAAREAPEVPDTTDSDYEDEDWEDATEGP